MYLKQIKDVLTLYGGLIILKVIMETKYQNLINYIQEQISDGQLGPGEKVPSENQLSEQFHISRQTVRKAIGVKHIRIKAIPNKWHENDCPFCHKSCPAYDKHSSRPTT